MIYIYINSINKISRNMSGKFFKISGLKKMECENIKFTTKFLRGHPQMHLI